MIECLNRYVLDHGMVPHVFNELKTLRIELEEVLARGEIYWRQKSKEVWLSDGDINTKIFHSSTKLKRSRNRISCIEDPNGKLLTESEDIALEPVRFFKLLLSSEGGNFMNDFIFDIPSLVFLEDNRMLMSPFSLEEVKCAVFTMNPNKAPGPDGFTPLFFQDCWYFVGRDVLLALEEARRNRSILK